MRLLVDCPMHQKPMDNRYRQQMLAAWANEFKHFLQLTLTLVDLVDPNLPDLPKLMSGGATFRWVARL